MDIFLEVLNTVVISVLAAIILLMIVVTYGLWTTIKEAKHFEGKLPIYALIAGANVVTFAAIQGLVILWA